MCGPVVLEFRTEFQEILEGRKRSELHFFNYLRLVFSSISKELCIRKQKTKTNKINLWGATKNQQKSAFKEVWKTHNIKLTLEESQFLF